MVFTTLLHSINSGKTRWLTSTAIAIFALFAGNTATLAEQHDSSTITSSTSGRIVGGVYLYGESAVPNVIGKEYIVFETIGNKTIGAFYLPDSEFSCFTGRFRNSNLNITLIDSYDQQKYNYRLALNPSGLTASKQPMMGNPTYQPLGKISAKDLQILASCKTQLNSGS